MNDLLLVIGAILLWLGGWLMGRASAFKAVRKQEEEFQRVRDSLYVPPPPPPHVGMRDPTDFGSD